MFWSWQTTRRWCTIGPASCSTSSTPGRPRSEEFRSRQFDLGLAWVSFPEGFGGLGLPPDLQREVDRRLAEAGARPPGAREFFGLTMAGPTVVTHGSDELRQRLLRPTFTGEESWCQLFSEPGAGSDLAGLATRAVRDGDEWVITGQKVWNTLAHIADRGMLVARTDPEAPKHKGLTYFALDMHAPGVEVRPLRQMTGEAEFNEVYLTEVRVPDADRIGDVGEGWRVAMTTLSNERTHHRRGRRAAGPRVRVHRRGACASGRSDGSRQNPVDRDRLDAIVDRGRGPAADQHAGRARTARPGNPGPEGSIAKLMFAEVNKRIYELCIDLLGADGPGRLRLHHAPVRGAGPGRAARVGPQDVHPVAGQLDRGRHVGDPAQHPRRADPRPARRRPGRQGAAVVEGAPELMTSDARLPRPRAGCHRTPPG